MTQGRVILLVGIPGSGKSTWAAAQGLPVLSSDALRLELIGDESNQSINEKVFDELRRRLIQLLNSGVPSVIVDATNLRAADRKYFMQVAAGEGATVEAVVFDVPLGVALERNRRRARAVPGDVIEMLSKRFEMPTLDEGFVRITSNSA